MSDSFRPKSCWKCGTAFFILSDGTKSGIGNVVLIFTHFLQHFLCYRKCFKNGNNIDGLFNYFRQSLGSRKYGITFLLIFDCANMIVGKYTITDGN